ncbi:uncharacterized protein A4U43_C07F26720 [Asparagus officinalis]|uniref:Uncharacterized protein n=1 Tax=Asparagus officinalis TaxID=4686 RepID=A0A5P1EKC6_ASPOF|nr:protein MCM10 homolog isoform X2 [Asparagus officinalis]ONK64500.1 uncharacterized protein A4U43_C07F26720 [Asparagus officinalis]
MSNPSDDLDLLLSLGEERVLETPPGSPPSSYSHLPDDGSPRGFRSSDMSVFRDAVKDYMQTEPSSINSSVPSASNKPRKSNEVDVEKYSGLRIKNQLVSAPELSNRFSEIRFVRLPVIRNLIAGDKFSGCWATVGVLIEKVTTKMSSSGKNYCVWKMGCLDETNVSVFLFGDAYTMNSNEPVGAVFALFNASLRKDASNGFSLSVYSASNISKIGTSTDYGICKGKRKDGVPCTMVINKRKGAYCKFHSSRSSLSQRYSTTRAELKGGNIKMPYKFQPGGQFQPEGIYMVDPLANRSNKRNSAQPVKMLSVDGLKKALSKAENVTTNSRSQGIRFLSHLTANVETKAAGKACAKPLQARNNAGVRLSSATEVASNISRESKASGINRPSVATKVASNIARENKVSGTKRKNNETSVNMIELDIVSSDEES